MTSMNKAERTYKLLRARILDGTYEPGRRLVLDVLARGLGVSQVPIREALRRLEAEGLVIYRRNIGAQVAPVDDERWEQEMAVLAVLEGLASALAADLLRPRDYKRLRDLNAGMAGALASGEMLSFSRLDRMWHSTICERCPNRYLVEMLDETDQRLDGIRSTVFAIVPERARESIDEHDHLTSLLERAVGSAEIEVAARRHEETTVRAFTDSRANKELVAE